MSLVDVMAVHIGEDAQFELFAFEDHQVAHHEPYALITLEACEGCERMTDDRRIIRLACEENEIIWRDADGARTWRVEVESHLLDLQTGESFMRLNGLSVQVGDLLYVVERDPVRGEARRRLLGRVRYVSVCA